MKRKVVILCLSVLLLHGANMIKCNALMNYNKCTHAELLKWSYSCRCDLWTAVGAIYLDGSFTLKSAMLQRIVRSLT